MRNFIQDFRFALRQMRRSPGFLITAVVTLALGVGANTAVYSLLDQALVRSLPVEKPEQLVVLSAPGKASSESGRERHDGAAHITARIEAPAPPASACGELRDGVRSGPARTTGWALR